MEHSSERARGFLTRSALFFLIGYVLLWLYTLFLTLNYYDKYLDKVQKHEAEQHARSDSAQPATRIGFDNIFELFTVSATFEQASHAFKSFSLDPTVVPSKESGTDDEKPPIDHKTIYSTLNDRLHEKQDLPTSIFKTKIVVIISALWFVTFLFANQFAHCWERKHRSLWQPFALMIDAHIAHQMEPLSRRLVDGLRKLMGKRRQAICDGVSRACQFTKKTAGLFISPHVIIKFLFGGLAIVPVVPFIIAMHQEYEPAVLVMALVAIFVAAEHYGGLSETEEGLKASSADLQLRLGTVLDSDGLNEWRTEVYRLYSKADKRIDGVIRAFDIDVQWWRCATATNRWEAYERLCLDDDTTLLSNLRTKRMPCVQFVTDLPMRPEQAEPGEAANANSAAFFRDLLGLAWHLVVFEKVHQHRLTADVRSAEGPPPYLRVKVAHAPCWMHVVDDTVYQVLERGAVRNSTVRNLSAGITNIAARDALVRWARASVHTLARRGGRAEEYVFSLLHRAAIQIGKTDNEALADVLDDILTKLGIEHWLDQPNDEFLLGRPGEPDASMNRSVRLSRATVKASCKAVFEELFRQRFSIHTCQITAWASDKPTVGHLASEAI